MVFAPRMVIRIAVLALFQTGIFICGAQAQSYPTRAITMIVPYPAGGPSDTLARVITERMSLQLRGEFYNLLNHAVFNIPGFTLGTADFGVVSSARSPRTAQLAIRLSF